MTAPDFVWLGLGALVFSFNYICDKLIISAISDIFRYCYL